MLFALIYLLVHWAVRLAAGSASDLHNDIEIMVLRHQLAVLGRQVGRPRLRRRDRLDESIGDDWANATFDALGNAVVTADRNVYRYDHVNKEWRSREGNLQITQFYDIALDPQNPDLMYGVAQDQVNAFKFDGTIQWSYMPGGGAELGEVLVDPFDSDLLYTWNPLDPTNLVQRSTEGGPSRARAVGVRLHFEGLPFDKPSSTA